MKSTKLFLILLFFVFLTVTKTAWTQGLTGSNPSNGIRDVELPCLPSHGGNDDVSAWCGPEIFTQTTVLSAGWNWFSTYIDATDVLAQLETGLGTNGIQISTQGAGLMYRNGSWIGTIPSISNSKGYKIRTSATVEITITGLLVDPANCPITINQGWNWIGYPLSESLSVGTALAGFTPADGDQIKTQGGGATYRSGQWLPATFTFVPGKSYAYKSTSSTTKTLFFPTSTR